jgi:hypothetical protein
MNRNKVAIHSRDQILNAARTVYQIVKLLKLTREDYLDMLDVDVFGKVDSSLPADDQRALTAFAAGVRDVYLTILLTEHCEFVYRSVDGVIWDVKEAIRQGAAERSQATCGHRWLDSDVDFTTFAKEVDPWI